MAIDFPNTPITGDLFTDHNMTEWICTVDTTGDVQWGRAPISDVITLTGQSGTTIADSVTLINNRSVKWMYPVTNENTNDVYSAEILAVHSNGSVEFSRYSSIGFEIAHTANVIVSGTNLALTITNDSTTAELYRYDIRQLQTAN